MDHTGGGGVDVVIVGTGVQGIELSLNVVHAVSYTHLDVYKRQP